MEILMIYAIVALSVALTSYWNIYRPAVDLYREISEDEASIVLSKIYVLMWIILATIAAPIIAILLLQGKNENIIKDLVLGWIGEEDE